DVDGVHIDLEFILKGDPYFNDITSVEKPGDVQAYGKNVNNFHKELRSVMPKAFISSVVVATSPGTEPWKRKTSMEELRQLTAYIDQLSFLYYDTSIDNQKDFEYNCKLLLEDIKTLKRDRNIEYLVAIGTFVSIYDLQHYRHLEIASVQNTLRTIKRQSYKVDPVHRIVDGIAIFCDWESDVKEWKDFNDNWNKFSMFF